MLWVRVATVATVATVHAMVAEIATIHNNGSRYCYHSPELVFRRWVRVATVATVATVHAMVAKIATIHNNGSKNCYHLLQLALSVDLLHLNIIKLRFLPSAKSVSKETVEGLGQSIQLNGSRW